MNAAAAPTLDASAVDGQPSAVKRAGDSLVLGVSIMLALTVVQRGVGFVRNLLFCRYLDETELGQWSLAFSFLVLAAPLAVLGLPGSFGRYVEAYRQRGQLKTFLFRTALVSGLLGLAATLCVAFAPAWMARLVFNDPSQRLLLAVSGLTLAAVVAFNFLVELLTSLRMFRLSSILQFIQGILFTVLGLAAVVFTGRGAVAVTASYGLATLLGIACIAPALRGAWRDLPTDRVDLPQRELWSRLLPFAAWVWVINLLANLFEVTDRAILVHFSGASVEASQGLVGQYHSSRVVPLLLVSLAAMFSGVLLPYLSRDWEAGRRTDVSRRVNMGIKLIALLFTAAGAATLLASPLLFDWVLANRYASGEAILPWALVGCIWFSLATVGQDYLWCAEKARLGALAFLGGLAANVGLGIVLTSRFGLPGAVAASCAANLLLMGLVYALCYRTKMTVDRGVWIASAAPLAIGLGFWPAVGVMAAVALIGWRTELLFRDEEKRQIAGWLVAARDKVRRGPWNPSGSQ